MMLPTAESLAAEPLSSYLWPHIIIAIFSLSTMVSLLTLCVSTHCCRNAKKKENPYGEIGASETSATDGTVSIVVSRNRTDPARLHHPNRLSHPNLSRHHPPAHRLSAPLPQSSAAMKRALPKLPQISAQAEAENPAAIYSTIDRSTPVADHDGSFLYGEGPTNPTYECIDADPLYSKLENGGPSTRRYDYPIFTPNNRQAEIADDAVYQSASQIYAGVSEDPYSSITSQAGGETSYDVGYSHVREISSAQPATNTDAEANDAQAESRNLDQLYTQIRRGPSMNRATDASTSRPPLPSNEFIVDYVSSGSDKTSREPSYRYITVRESIDAIRQRLSELENNNTSTTPPQPPPQPPPVATDSSGGPIREHYYSSIGGGSDYETLQISTIPNSRSFYDNQSASSQSVQPETSSSAALISVDGNMPPKPPTSPIPVRTADAVEEIPNLDSMEPSSSGIRLDGDVMTIDDNESSSTASEKIKKLRTNFFDQKWKSSEDLEQPSSSSSFPCFEQIPDTVNRGEISEQPPNSVGNNEASETNIDSEMPVNFSDSRLQHSSAPSPSSQSSSFYPNFCPDFYHRAEKTTRINPSSLTVTSTILSTEQENMFQRYHKNITKEMRSHSFHEQSIFGIKQPSTKDMTSSNGEGNYPLAGNGTFAALREWNSAKFLEDNTDGDESRSFSVERRAVDSEGSSQVPIERYGGSDDVNSALHSAGPNLLGTTLPYRISQSMASSVHNVSYTAGGGIEDLKIQSFSHPQSTVELTYARNAVENDDRSVQVASLNFSCESLEQNVPNDVNIRNETGITVGIDRSWPLISSGKSVLSYVNRTESEKTSEIVAANRLND